MLITAAFRFAELTAQRAIAAVFLAGRSIVPAIKRDSFLLGNSPFFLHLFCFTNQV